LLAGVSDGGQLAGSRGSPKHRRPKGPDLTDAPASLQAAPNSGAPAIAGSHAPQGNLPPRALTVRHLGQPAQAGWCTAAEMRDERSLAILQMSADHSQNASHHCHRWRSHLCVRQRARSSPSAIEQPLRQLRAFCRPWELLPVPPGWGRRAPSSAAGRTPARRPRGAPACTRPGRTRA